jgi:hypothetical protein
MTPAAQALAAALVLGAALLGTAFFIGQRRNRRIALRTARELEEALAPIEKTYTWIGGLIGFHARYEVAGFRDARATCTLLPRHAPLYLPLALVLGRGDRAHVTLYLDTRFEGEAHLISSAHLRSPLVHIEGRGGMKERSCEAGGRRFILLATQVRLLSQLEKLLGRIDREGLARHVRHIALVPDLSTLYAQVVPGEGIAGRIASVLTTDAREIAIGAGGSGS